MTTAARAVERIAEATGDAPGVWFRIARALREWDGELFPEGGKGRNRAAHVDPSHLTNLMLGYAARSVQKAPETVEMYRSLRVFADAPTKTDEQAAADGRLFPDQGKKGPYGIRAFFANAASLGSAMDALIDCLADPALPAGQRQRFRDASFNVLLVLDSHFATAEASFYKSNSVERVTIPFIEKKAANLGVPAARIKRHIILPADLFIVLADIWAGLEQPSENDDSDKGDEDTKGGSKGPRRHVPTTKAAEDQTAAPPPRGTAAEGVLPAPTDKTSNARTTNRETRRDTLQFPSYARGVSPSSISRFMAGFPPSIGEPPCPNGS